MRVLIGGSPCTHWRPVPEYEGFYDSTGGYKFRYLEEVILHG